MKTTLDVNVRAFPVNVFNHITGEHDEVLVVLTKEHLQAAQLVGQSSKELITRICARNSCEVEHIGKPEKREISMDLEELYKAHYTGQRGKREKVDA